MSRAYSIVVECVSSKITEDSLYSELINEWNHDASTWTNEDEDAPIICFNGDGSLYGGESEEEAHERISKQLRVLDADAKIQTTWTYLEDLPTETYGGLK